MQYLYKLVLLLAKYNNNSIIQNNNYDCFIHSFFFQAEDGIRDYKVTGVQTCALPIYRSSAVMVPISNWDSYVSYDAAADLIAWRHPSENPSAWPGYGQPAVSRDGSVYAIQIGRASCRERVEVAGAADSGEERERNSQK